MARRKGRDPEKRRSTNQRADKRYRAKMSAQGVKRKDTPAVTARKNLEKADHVLFLV